MLSWILLCGLDAARALPEAENIFSVDSSNEILPLTMGIEAVRECLALLLGFVIVRLYSSARIAAMHLLVACGGKVFRNLFFNYKL